jgi:hypothetical protein
MIEIVSIHLVIFIYQNRNMGSILSYFILFNEYLSMEETENGGSSVWK